MVAFAIDINILLNVVADVGSSKTSLDVNHTKEFLLWCGQVRRRHYITLSCTDG